MYVVIFPRNSHHDSFNSFHNFIVLLGTNKENYRKYLWDFCQGSIKHAGLRASLVDTVVVQFDGSHHLVVEVLWPFVGSMKKEIVGVQPERQQQQLKMYLFNIYLVHYNDNNNNVQQRIERCTQSIIPIWSHGEPDFRSGLQKILLVY